jgi:hypothetical protein
MYFYPDEPDFFDGTTKLQVIKLIKLSYSYLRYDTIFYHKKYSYKIIK